MFRVAVISDTQGYSVMDTALPTQWIRNTNVLRNKTLLAPDYGVMCVTAFLKEQAPEGLDLQVINLIADIFGEVELYRDVSEGLPQEETDCPLNSGERREEARRYLREALRDYLPHAVLYPLPFYYLALHGREVLKEIRKAVPEAWLVTGGPYATLHAREILEDGAADFVVRGEGEWITLELLSALARGEREFSRVRGLSWKGGGRIYHNPPREREKDIDRFPHMYTVAEEFRIALRHRILNELRTYEDYIPGNGMLTARGCYGACTFCLDPVLWGRKTARHGTEYVRRVVEWCWDNYPDESRLFYFGDASFVTDRDWLFELLGMLRDIPYAYNAQTRVESLTPEVLRAMAECNFATVGMGAESFNHDVLRRTVRKRGGREEVLRAAREARRLGMRAILSFIVGLPGEGRDSLEETLETLRREGIKDAAFFPLVVFRGTELFERLAAERTPEEMEELRLTPWSEEYYMVGEEFPTVASLVRCADELNLRVREVP
ncbi:MAG: radical SAM protein [Actinomycetota bacterium]|nr:radical SAM protein [Actinomycetota bacterium]